MYRIYAYDAVDTRAGIFYDKPNDFCVGYERNIEKANLIAEEAKKKYPCHNIKVEKKKTIRKTIWV